MSLSADVYNPTSASQHPTPAALHIICVYCHALLAYNSLFIPHNRPKGCVVCTMNVVRSIFLNEKQAQNALDQLRTIFPDDSIEMQRVYPNKRRNVTPGEYDPVGSALLAGTAVATMAATGANMVGNSTTLDVSLGDADAILAMVAQNEQMPAYQRSQRILATVSVNNTTEAENALEIMRLSGGRCLDSTYES
jgi:hypothetical protein